MYRPIPGRIGPLYGTNANQGDRRTCLPVALQQATVTATVASSRLMPGEKLYRTHDTPRWSHIVPRGALLDLDARYGITTSGSMVTSWTDGVSGLVFSEATNGPTYSSSSASFNGFPSVSFDGTDDILVSTAAASTWKILHAGTGLTVMVCIRPTGTNATQNVLATRTNGAEVGFNWVFDGSANKRCSLQTHNGAAFVANAPTGSDTFQLDRVMVGGVTYTETPSGYPSQSSDQFGWVCATRRANADTSATPSAADPAGTLRLGSNRGGANFFTGEVSRIAIWTVVLSAEEIFAVHRRCFRSEMFA